MSDLEKKRPAQIVVSTRPRASSGDSVATRASLKPPSLRSPRTARFAEATAVHSPIEPRSNHFMAQPQVSDLGFGYVHNKHESVEMPDTDNNDYPAMKTPLKSAMRTPGAPPRDMGNMLSPTFKEEQQLEKDQAHTDKEQARDLRIKGRVRIAKFFLRGINFSCALIIISMLSATFTIFNATKSIPPRNNLPPWAENQKIWPQVLLISIASIMLAVCIWVFYSYWKGGHRRAEKTSVYYSAFAVGFFIFSIVMWGIAAGAMQGSKNNSNNKDMWGWSCVDNQRKSLFEKEIQYDLVCRLQNWSLVCIIIEIVVETITIAVYGIVFYRFYSKNQLRKSMAVRDRARSDMYLAQLRSQSAPNTPGLAGPFSPRDGGYKPSVHAYVNGPSAEEGDIQYIDASHQSPPKAFQLQAPPIRVQTATPKMAQVGFTSMETSGRERSRTPSPPIPEQDQRSPLMAEMPREQQQEHFGAAPGEQVYDAVPIPGAYQPMSPTHTGGFQGR